MQDNPSTSRRQQRFMCTEYGRKKRGQRTCTGMSVRQLREFCMARTRRMKNPHLTSGKWRFVGMFVKGDIGSVKRLLKIHSIKMKVTKDHVKGEKGQREVYVERGAFDTAYRAISRLFDAERTA